MLAQSWSFIKERTLPVNPVSKIFTKSMVALALVGAIAAPAVAQQQAAASPVDAMKAELNIKPAQEASWKKFVDAYSLPFTPSQNLSSEQFNAMKTPERVALLKKLHSEQNAFIFNRFDASVALYNALDANQKKTFDDMTADRPAPAQQRQAAPASKGRAKK